MNLRIVAYAVYCICYEAIIWGVFGYGVFYKERSGWWIALAVLCSCAQLRPKRFGITETPTHD